MDKQQDVISIAEKKRHYSLLKKLKSDKGLSKQEIKELTAYEKQKQRQQQNTIEPIKLTPKQERFCREYIIDMNAKQAAIRAGYSKKTSHSTGIENLKKPYLKEFIAELQKSTVEKIEITAERVLQELSSVGFCEDGSVRTNDKLKALELLGKHLSLFTDNISIKEMPKVNVILKGK
jgi:phage terminase small subunit